jgi:hypothetical protein
VKGGVLRGLELVLLLQLGLERGELLLHLLGLLLEVLGLLRAGSDNGYRCLALLGMRRAAMSVRRADRTCYNFK